MEAFSTHKGIVATLDTANVDTDQIIAKQFLKSIKRTGFGEHLFHDWRFDDAGNLNKDFSLNAPEFQGASILVARNNFGCGSSREHAVWAIQQYGFKVVIAPSKEQAGGNIPGFADIFRNNCGKNGLLTIELSENTVDGIFDLVSNQKGVEGTIDLENQTITIHANEETVIPFEVDTALKDRLLKGLDDIGLTLNEESSITEFENHHNSQMPTI